MLLKKSKDKALDHLGLVTRGRLNAKPWYFTPNHSRKFNEVSYLRIKRFLDIIFCIVALPFILTILALLFIIIKLDSRGPVFFAQERTGKDGRRFRMFKLRTMVQNADELKEDFLHLNELNYPDFKIKNDPRITKVGSFLRKTSLDELPQIFNVIRGDMSLVGPRPTSFSAETYSLWQTTRLNLQPGITGLWQVMGRNELEFDDRLRLDIAYERNRTIWLDTRIMLRTISCIFHKRGAH